MSQKTLVWIGLTVGSALGSYVPVLWGGDIFSFTSIWLSALGGILGIWAGFKLGQR